MACRSGCAEDAAHREVDAALAVGGESRYHPADAIDRVAVKNGEDRRFEREPARSGVQAALDDEQVALFLVDSAPPVCVSRVGHVVLPSLSSFSTALLSFWANSSVPSFSPWTIPSPLLRPGCHWNVHLRPAAMTPGISVTAYPRNSLRRLRSASGAAAAGRDRRRGRRGRRRCLAGRDQRGVAGIGRRLQRGRRRVGRRRGQARRLRPGRHTAAPTAVNATVRILSMSSVSSPPRCRASAFRRTSLKPDATS